MNLTNQTTKKMKKNQDKREEIDLDTSREKGTLVKGASTKKGKDNQLIIMIFVFLGILTLMGITQTHWIAITAVAVVEAIVIVLQIKKFQ